MTGVDYAKFAAAVDKGYSLMANQQTIDQLKKVWPEFAETFEPSPYLDTGTLYAVDLSRFGSFCGCVIYENGVWVGKPSDACQCGQPGKQQYDNGLVIRRPIRPDSGG